MLTLGGELNCVSIVCVSPATSATDCKVRLIFHLDDVSFISCQLCAAQHFFTWSPEIIISHCGIFKQ